MIRSFLSALGVFAMIAAATGGPLSISPVQCTQLVEIDVEGRGVPAIPFSTDRRAMFFLPLSEEQRNWTDRTVLHLRLYNKEAGDAEFLIFLRDAGDSKAANLFPRRHFWKKIRADWTGWMDLEIPLTQFMPSTGCSEDGVKGPPVEVTQIGFCNHFGPEDPAVNTWGIPVPHAFTVGIESITVQP